MADTDGLNARQVSRDGFDAQNPTMTADGQWIVYSSNKPGSEGVFRVRADRSDSTQVVSGNLTNPEVSPSGLYVAFAKLDIA